MKARLFTLSLDRKTIALLMLCFFSHSSLAQQSLRITGSDTLAPVLTAWLEVFKTQHIGLRIELQSTGSATVPTALAEGTVDIGAMSRPMTSDEISLFANRRGFMPRAIAIARDSLAIIVHPSNPIRDVALNDLDRIFSRQVLCSGSSPLVNWREIGQVDSQPGSVGSPIDTFGRTATSGSYGYFKQVALCGGDYDPSMMEFEGFASLVDAIANSESGIGYTGFRWVDQRVKPLAVRIPVAEGATLTVDHTHPRYPLNRSMYLYWVQAPNTQLSPLQCEFLVFSQTAMAQQMVVAEGLTAIRGSADYQSRAQRHHVICE